tara:strand:- start:464 stop:817 length:354 start_codon:yes stop_codon:yes gene_type:complete
MDFIWLNYIGKSWYQHYYGEFLGQPLMIQSWYAVIISYLLIVIGLSIFIISNYNKSFLEPLLYGGLYGVCLYGVFNYTNMAILPNWNIFISIIDTLWGGFVCGVTAMLVYFINKYVF